MLQKPNQPVALRMRMFSVVIFPCNIAGFAYHDANPFCPKLANAEKSVYCISGGKEVEPLKIIMVLTRFSATSTVKALFKYPFAFDDQNLYCCSFLKIYHAISVRRHTDM